MGLTVGVDIVEVSRIRKALRNPRFLTRVFTETEIAYCRRKTKPAVHFAARYAAKEATYKALGRAGIPYRDIGVVNGSSGAPRLSLTGRAKAWSHRLSVSLSHTDQYAVAVVFPQKEKGQ